MFTLWAYNSAPFQLKSDFSLIKEKILDLCLKQHQKLRNKADIQLQVWYECSHSLTFDLLRGFEIKEVTQVHFRVNVVRDFALVE